MWEWLIPSVLSTVGGLFTNRSNARMAQRQMDFQRDMSNTSYQRSREDMIRAGINPAMMSHTGGASSPSGASAVLGNAVEGGVSSAQSARRVASEVRNAASMTAASTDKMKAEADESRTRAAVAKAQVGLIQEDILSRQLDRSLRTAMQPADLRLRAAQAMASEAAARLSGVSADRSLRLLPLDVEATSARAALDRSGARLNAMREPKMEMMNNLYESGKDATGWFDRNVRTNARDAIDAAGGWSSALQSYLNGYGIWMRNNLFNNQQPRARAMRK